MIILGLGPDATLSLSFLMLLLWAKNKNSCQVSLKLSNTPDPSCVFEVPTTSFIVAFLDTNPILSHSKAFL